jgi:hypothetical protein
VSNEKDKRLRIRGLGLEGRHCMFIRDDIGVYFWGGDL